MLLHVHLQTVFKDMQRLLRQVKPSPPTPIPQESPPGSPRLSVAADRADSAAPMSPPPAAGVAGETAASDVSPVPALPPAPSSVQDPTAATGGAAGLVTPSNACEMTDGVDAWVLDEASLLDSAAKACE